MDGLEGGEVQGGNPDGGGASGPNPAWNDVLGVIPKEYHDAVTPHFQKWDQSAQQRIEQANSQVQAFEAYQPFLEHGIDPQELENGLRLMYEINNNPKSVWDALGKAYSLTETGEEPGEGEGAEGNFQDPRFDQLQQGIELVSKIVLEDQQSKASAKADAELEAELGALRQKYGDFDEGYVLAMMQNEMPGDAAVQAFQSFRNSLLQNNPRPFAPNVMGNSAGGMGYPSQQVDPTKLSGKDTRNMVVEMLRAAANQQ